MDSVRRRKHPQLGYIYLFNKAAGACELDTQYSSQRHKPPNKLSVGLRRRVITLMPAVNDELLGLEGSPGVQQLRLPPRLQDDRVALPQGPQEGALRHLPMH